MLYIILSVIFKDVLLRGDIYEKRNPSLEESEGKRIIF